MNIGDLVEDDWGEIAIITSQASVKDRWYLKYIATGAIAIAWGANLYPLGCDRVKTKGISPRPTRDQS